MDDDPVKARIWTLIRKATRPPWRYTKTHADEIRGADGSLVAGMYGRDSAVLANARFIVEAVNTYDTLHDSVLAAERWNR